RASGSTRALTRSREASSASFASRIAPRVAFLRSRGRASPRECAPMPRRARGTCIARMLRMTRGPILTIVALLAAACAHEAPRSARYGTTTLTSATTLSEDEAAAISATINSGEVTLAQLAEARAADPNVRRYADHMMRD